MAKNAAVQRARGRGWYAAVIIALVWGVSELSLARWGGEDSVSVDDSGDSESLFTLTRVTPEPDFGSDPLAFLRGEKDDRDTIVGRYLASPMKSSEAALGAWLMATTRELAGEGFQAAPLGPIVGQPSEIECLALNVYFESRGESVRGRHAVANVTMNRVFDEAFPNTVCEVVRQGAMDGRKARRNSCQFSWWCDGRSDRPVDQRAWENSLEIAQTVYWDRSRDPTDGALWFHAQYVDPKWASSFDRGPQIGKHLFYKRPDPDAEPEPFYLPWSL